MTNLVEIKKEKAVDRPDEPVGPFAVGAVVKLNSGGVHMTVRSATKTKGIVVIKVEWMDQADDLQVADFDARQLRIPPEEEND